MSDGWTTIYGRDAYDGVIALARSGQEVVIDGYLHIITHVEFDGIENRGRYKVQQVDPLPFGGLVHALHEPDDNKPRENHIRDAVRANR
ncbi:hypothetical protein [Paraburkholderia caffeinilytica]|uniref:hypothetical protein n=1 Tax=Paraburkholderia caffeinilytica TaxID=1761016 RepID=UPI0038BC3E0C